MVRNNPDRFSGHIVDEIEISVSPNTTMGLYMKKKKDVEETEKMYEA